jgi:UDPglucose 6-dehydrogenase
MRDAASLVIASRLLAEGAEVRAHDPVAIDAARPLLQGVALYDDVRSMVEGVDAVVLITEWPEYAELDLVDLASRMRTPLLVDGRNVFSPSQAQHAGLAYEGIGRPGVGLATPRRRAEDASAESKREV